MTEALLAGIKFRFRDLPWDDLILSIREDLQILLVSLFLIMWAIIALRYLWRVCFPAAEEKPPEEKPAGEKPEASDPDKIHVSRKGEPIGPYSREKAKEYFASGQLLPTDWGWHDGMDDWKPLNDVLGIGKSKVGAAIFCYVFGYLGAHRFYLGYTTIGIIQLCTCGGFFIWWFIDFILILTGKLNDSDGQPLRMA